MKARARDFVTAAVLLLLGRRSRPPREPAHPPVVSEGPPSPGPELAVIALLGAATVCAVAFMVVYGLDRLGHQTQLLGLALGLAFLFLAAAFILTGKKLVVTEELEEDYPTEHPQEQETIEQLVEESGSRLTRRRLLKLAVAGAGGSLGLALLTPALSLGPALDMSRFYGTPWRRGRRLVDDEGKPIKAADIERDDLYTAFPEGADREEEGSSVVLVRLPPGDLKLPPENAGYDANGIVAYSKICTHAGCAISLYRAPLFQPTEPRPALVCPCHYSTFDPADGGSVTFGPAGRKLPMLPLRVDRAGHLRAAGNFDSPVGASWWGVRMRKPSP